MPSRAADRDELLSLSAVVGEHPGTTLQIGTFFSAPEESGLLAAMSLAADRPINFNPGTETLDICTQAAADGACVLALTTPTSPELRLVFLTNIIFPMLPGWDDLYRKPVPDRVALLRDPEVRMRLKNPGASTNLLRTVTDWPNLEIAETFDAANVGLEGRLIGDIARERGQEPFDALMDIVLRDELRTGLLVHLGDKADADAWRARAERCKDSRTIVGGSDAGAHLDMQCGASQSTNFLEEMVRERGLFTYEEAIHQITDVPSRLYGLRGRGRLTEGFHADIVLFDPDGLHAGPTRTRADLPGKSVRLYAEAEGIKSVYVNGHEVVRDGVATGEMPGSVLRSGRDTDTVSAPMALRA